MLQLFDHELHVLFETDIVVNVDEEFVGQPCELDTDLKEKFAISGEESLLPSPPPKRSQGLDLGRLGLRLNSSRNRRGKGSATWITTGSGAGFSARPIARTRRTEDAELPPPASVYQNEEQWK